MGGHLLQKMAIFAIKQFLVQSRIRDEELRHEVERENKEKDRCLRRIMNVNLRYLGMAFRQAYLHMNNERDSEVMNTFKMRGIIRKMVDSTTRLLGMGFNKLIQEWRLDQQNLKDKMRFVIASLRDRNSMLLLMAYNGFKQRA